MNRRIAFPILMIISLLVGLVGIGTVPLVGAVGPGVALSWGFNQQGQLGNGTNADSSLPIQALLGGANGRVTQIAAATAGNHILALLNDGTVMSWGENQVGNLGRGNNTVGNPPSSSTPGFVTDPTGVSGTKLSNVKMIAAGGGNSMALTNDGNVYVWGDNSLAQHGQGFPGAPKGVPTLVGLLSGQGVVEIVGGGAQMLARTQAGKVYCWGNNNFGQCGVNSSNASGDIVVVPTLVHGENNVGTLSNVKEIGAGGGHSLAVLNDGSVLTWGYNQNGQIGDGFAPNHSCCALSPVPIRPVGLGGRTFTRVSGGDTHSLALESDGTVWAWGHNTLGQLGQGGFNGGPNPEPVHIAASALNGIIDIQAGGSEGSMALKNDGTVWMWGSNKGGQLGIGAIDTSDHGTPTQVLNLGSVLAITRGNDNAVAISSGYRLTTATAGVTIPPNGGPGNGTVSPVSGDYALNKPVSVTPTPDANSIFIGWTLDGVDAGWAVPKTVTMDGPHTLVANFVATPAFTDVPQKPSLPKSDPAYPTTYAAVTQLAARGVIRGYGDGTYGPANKIFRSEQAALIGRPLYATETANNPFSDKCLLGDAANCIDPELWNFVAVLNAHHIALGYSDAATCSPQAAPCYDPRAEVTFAQGISFITRTMVDKGYWTRQPINPNLYNGALNGTGHEQDFATYAHYATAPPDFPVGSSFTKAELTSAGTRGWFAKALWKALDSQFGPASAP